MDSDVPVWTTPLLPGTGPFSTATQYTFVQAEANSFPEDEKMIEIKRDKEIIRVESMDAVRARPGFNPNLDPAKHALDSIIGRYVESDMVICGLSNCRTPHVRGYIVSTKDGQETNIGKDCGKKYFGVDFETQSRRFDRDIAEKEYRDQMWSFNFQLDALKERIREMRDGDGGADWIQTRTRYLLIPGKGCPEVIQALRDMIRVRRRTLQITRPASEEEAIQLEVAQGRKVPRPAYITEDLTEVDGIEALYPENDLHELLIMKVAQRIAELEILDIDTLAHKDLRMWVQWIHAVEQTMDNAQKAIAYGRSLLTRANLSPFEHIIQDKRSITPFRKFLESLAP